MRLSRSMLNQGELEAAFGLQPLIVEYLPYMYGWPCQRWPLPSWLSF